MDRSAAALIIAAMILASSWSIVRETLHILLEGTPRSVDLVEIRGAMQSIEGVVNVHDLHVWSLTSQSHAMACHVQVVEMQLAECEDVLANLHQVHTPRRPFQQNMQRLPHNAPRARQNHRGNNQAQQRINPLQPRHRYHQPATITAAVDTVSPSMCRNTLRIFTSPENFQSSPAINPFITTPAAATHIIRCASTATG